MNGCLRRIPELLPLQCVTFKFLEFRFRQSNVSLQLWIAGFPSFSPFFFKLSFFTFSSIFILSTLVWVSNSIFAFSRFNLSSSILSWLCNLSFSISAFISICFSLFLCFISNCFSFPSASTVFLFLLDPLYSVKSLVVILSVLLWLLFLCLHIVLKVYHFHRSLVVCLRSLNSLLNIFSCSIIGFSCTFLAKAMFHPLVFIKSWANWMVLLKSFFSCLIHRCVTMVMFLLRLVYLNDHLECSWIPNYFLEFLCLLVFTVPFLQSEQILDLF